MTHKTHHYNMLSCPQCCNLLVDHLAEYEKNSAVKTVKCSNTGCDYVGKREGFQLFTLEQIKVYNESQKALLVSL